jgi:hypothetical protein
MQAQSVRNEEIWRELKKTCATIAPRPGASRVAPVLTPFDKDEADEWLELLRKQPPSVQQQESRFDRLQREIDGLFATPQRSFLNPWPKAPRVTMRRWADKMKMLIPQHAAAS